MWFTDYKHQIESRPEGWAVLIWHNGKLIQELVFDTCNAALSFVERREGCQASSL